MKERKCAICGMMFIPASSRQKYCNKPVERECVVCGNKYMSTCTASYAKCCSPKCKQAYASKQRAAGYPVKLCAWCQKEFKPKSSTQIYCSNKHYNRCIVCSQIYEIDLTVQDKRMTCSDTCLAKLKSSNLNTIEAHEKAKQSMIDRYGVAHPAQCTEFLEKQKATTKERYGVEFFTQSNEYKEAAIKTNRERYGSDWASQSLATKNKVKDTVQSRYGVDNVMKSEEVKQTAKDQYHKKTGYFYSLQNPEVRDKGKQTMLEKYGESSYSKTQEFKDKFRETSIARYGEDNPMKSEEIRNKVASTNIEKYGAPCYLGSEEGRKKARLEFYKKYGVYHYLDLPEWKQNHIQDSSKLDEWMKFLDNPEKYLISVGKMTYRELSNMLGVSDSTISYYVNKLNLQDLVKYTLSYMEEEVTSFIESISDEVITRHDRQSIRPNELDICVKNKKIAFECNPTSTHNSSAPFIDSEPIMPGYHKMKTDKCEQAGIFLFHIFGYEWTHKKPIIQSMIRNLLGKNNDRIYARKCEVKEVDAIISYTFLQDNHRQGGVHSKVRLGLYYEDNLVSIMTFGKMRNTIGTGNEDLDDCWELVRFCNKLDTSVIGGASKLFNYFVKHYQPDRIRSFSDRAHTRGKLYSKLGFAEVTRSDPNYVWVNVETDKACHRANAQKQNIRKFLHDDSIDLSKTEREIMIEHGFVQVYDSGTITWEWKNPCIVENN
nr:MAG TPA: endonuclease-like protein [Caudoviricetes sp.]